MYQLRQEPPERHHYWRYVIVGLFLIILVAAGLFVFRRIFQAHTTITQSSAVTRYYNSAGAVPTQHIKEKAFSVDLPKGWQPTTTPNAPNAMYSWRGTNKNDATRRIDIYVDDVPLGLAVNRLLPVRVDSAHLEPTDAVSDNCVDFTEKTAQSRKTGTAPSKWSGVSFICDMGNYERDVVATGSTAGVNTIIVSGPAAGRHHVLLVYTDNGPSPDYSVFTSIVKSFSVL